jgi:hypothetical protein
MKPDGTVGKKEELTYPPGIPIETREDAIRLGCGYDARLPFNMGVNAYISAIVSWNLPNSCRRTAHSCRRGAAG